MKKYSNPRSNGTENGRYMTEPDDLLAPYFSSIEHTKPLSREEEYNLARRIKEGDTEANDKLIEANLRFVIGVAKGYATDSQTLVELIAEGNTGVIEAARRFDETRNLKFITYAVWWIRQSILQRLVNYRRVIDLPGNSQNYRSKIEDAINTLDMKYERLIDPLSYLEEISKLTGISKKGIEALLVYGRKQSSLDASINDEETSLYDVIPDRTKESPEEGLMRSALKKDVAEALRKIPDVEATVLRLYFGIGEERAHNLEEIGKMFGKTRERIRQIKEKALGRLRHPSNVTALREHAPK
ncbi:MAG: sigma-70 family RNA polymerase sigma factor [Nanoarchaeota archaeon]